MTNTASVNRIIEKALSTKYGSVYLIMTGLKEK